MPSKNHNCNHCKLTHKITIPTLYNHFNNQILPYNFTRLTQSKTKLNFLTTRCHLYLIALPVFILHLLFFIAIQIQNKAAFVEI